MFRFFFTHVNANGLKKSLADQVMKRRLTDIICDNYPQTYVSLSEDKFYIPLR